MKPVAYGYLRVTDDRDDDPDPAAGVSSLQACRGGKDSVLCRFSMSMSRAVTGAFIELVEELKRGQADHVVVPSLDRLSAHPLLQEGRIMCLVTIGARVWVVE